jgi:ubiquinone/menaquinone biosynthesis C-methylase UbiE
MISIMNVAHSGMVKWALERTQIAEDSVILDIGCGGGNTIKALSKIVKSGKIFGIDYSEQSVKNSIVKNKKYVDTGKVIIKRASVSNIPFSENSFDTITAFQTHYFWPDLENDMKEVYRVLKQDGQFIIVSELYKIKYHMKRFKTKEEMEKLFRKVGYNAVKIYENGKWICFIGIK